MNRKIVVLPMLSLNEQKHQSTKLTFIGLLEWLVVGVE